MNPETRRLARRSAKRITEGRRAEYRAGKGRCPVWKKARFTTWDMAVAAALRLSHNLGRPIRAYACPDCAGWHLTRQPTPPTKDTP